MTDELDLKRKKKFASKGAEIMVKTRHALIDAIPDDLHAGFVTLSGLSLFLEIAKDYADDVEEFKMILSQALEIAEIQHELSHRDVCECPPDETVH